MSLLNKGIFYKILFCFNTEKQFDLLLIDPSRFAHESTFNKNRNIFYFLKQPNDKIILTLSSV